MTHAGNVNRLVVLICAGLLWIGCTLSAPALELQDRVDRTKPGDTLRLAPEEHDGPITIEQPIHLVGTPGETVIDGNLSGHAIHVLADDVTLENLTVVRSGRSHSGDNAAIRIEGADVTVRNCRIANSLHGIYIRKASGAYLAGNHITGTAVDDDDVTDPEKGDNLHADHHYSVQENRGNGIHFFHSSDATVKQNRIEEVRDGIYFSYTSNTEILNNRIHRARYGLHYMYSHRNVFRKNQFSNSVAGAAVMFSRNLEIEENVFHHNQGSRSWGMLLQDVENSSIRRNRLTSNRAGLRLQNSHRNTFRGNIIRGNREGIRLASSSRRNRFTRNVMGPNHVNVALSGKPPETSWSLDGRGNYWPSARVLDLNGDGTGNVPHYERDLLGGVRKAFPPIQLLQGSPGLRLLEWGYQRAPAPGEFVIRDPHPLTSPPEFSPNRHASHGH